MFEYFPIQPDQELPHLAKSPPFKCALICEVEVSPVWREKVCRWLLDNGCLFLMTWGNDCKAWHDSADDAFFAKYESHPVPDGKFVLTTWHNDETIEDLIFFAKIAAAHGEVALERLLILSIGSSTDENALRAIYENT